MGLLGNGTVGHGAGLKPFYNGFHALDLVNWNSALFIIAEIDQITQVDGLIFPIQRMGVLFKCLIIAGSCSLLQQVDGNRVIQMFLLSGTHLVAAHAVQGQIHIQSQRIKRCRMQGIYVIGDIIQCDTSHAADGVCKIFINYFLADTDGLKDLRALVGLDGGNTHLGSNLDDAVKDCGVVIIHCRIVILIHHAGLNQVFDGLMSQIRVDGAGTVA